MSGPRPIRDHYAVLGLRAEASPEQITSAYRTLIRALHPDAHPGGGRPDGDLAEVIAAYRTLRDPERRSVYDAERRRVGQAPRQPVRVPVRVRTHSATVAAPQPFLRAVTDPRRVTAQPVEDSFSRLLGWLFNDL
ncbi:J domain-containing protein [Streptomyces sp. NPDC091268]|uniref:J domain-containing protein n=1 Tax=Streptomyces sp. NPDC091268 TaxID=3365979 RepID=UPI0037F30942